MTPRERIKELTDEIAKVANENDFKILLVTSYITKATPTDDGGCDFEHSSDVVLPPLEDGEFAPSLYNLVIENLEKGFENKYGMKVFHILTCPECGKLLHES